MRSKTRWAVLLEARRPPQLSEIAAELNSARPASSKSSTSNARIDLQGLPDNYADGGPVADPGEVHSLHLSSFSLPIEIASRSTNALDARSRRFSAN